MVQTRHRERASRAQLGRGLVEERGGHWRGLTVTVDELLPSSEMQMSTVIVRMSIAPTILVQQCMAQTVVQGTARGVAVA